MGKCRKQWTQKTLAERTVAFEARFHARIDRSAGLDACWAWQGPLNDGYGFVNRPMPEGKFQQRRVHVVAWALANAHWPSGRQLTICHQCDNRACVNPKHLYLGRQRSSSESNKRKLNDSEVREIRELWATGEWSAERLGEEFDVHRSTIWRLVHGKVYQDVK